MEVSLSDIVAILTLFIGGGSLGGFFTWRYTRRKEKAEAKSAEIDMAQKVQDTYQEMLEYKQKEVDDNHRLINELREDRDHYKQDRNELRDRLGKMEDTVLTMKSDIARNERNLKEMRPFMCGDLTCKLRQRVPVSADEGVKRKKQAKKDIEPINSDEL